MSSYIAGTVVGALIVAATTVLMFVLTGRREKRIRADERAAADRGELQRAMREYLATIDVAVLEAEQEFPRLRQTRIDRWLEKVLDGTSLEFLGLIFVRLLQRAVHGHRTGEVLDRLAAASAHLRLIAPPEVEARMTEFEDVAKRHEPGDKRWLEEWKAVRSATRNSFRQALDHLSADVE